MLPTDKLNRIVDLQVRDKALFIGDGLNDVQVINEA